MFMSNWICLQAWICLNIIHTLALKIAKWKLFGEMCTSHLVASRRTDFAAANLSSALSISLHPIKYQWEKWRSKIDLRVCLERLKWKVIQIELSSYPGKLIIIRLSLDYEADRVSNIKLIKAWYQFIMLLEWNSRSMSVPQVLFHRCLYQIENNWEQAILWWRATKATPHSKVMAKQDAFDNK